MPRYWIGVASREHVLRGVKDGFCQVCHGKAAPLKRMSPGDWIIYYSPTSQFMPAPTKKLADNSCQKFTAIGKIKSLTPYQFQMAPDFIPWRHDVDFFPATEVAITPLVPQLAFIKNKQSWGFPFRRGCFEISAADCTLIAAHMGIKLAI